MEDQNRKLTTGVLYGGNSAERAISLRSGHAVLNALKAAGINAVGIDVQFDDTLFDQIQGIDRAFIALHGRGGEDGVIQAVLSVMEIPFTGSAVMASALGMDKLRCKQIWLGCGLPTPEFAVVNNEDELEAAFDRLGSGAVMVKPPHEGSSIGMSKVTEIGQLYRAFSQAREHDDTVLLERWIEGREFTCAVLNGQALPVIQLQTPNDFYDFEAKYESSQTQYLCPCGLSEAEEKQLQQLALDAFNAIGCAGWGRVDVMQDNNGQFYLLEVNTVPGMTNHSLVPMAAKAAGMDFQTLVTAILDGADLK